MIPIELQMMELEGDLGRVAAWLECRFPELGQIRLESALQDVCTHFPLIPYLAVMAGGAEIRSGLAVEEARRCISEHGWRIYRFEELPIAMGVHSYAVGMGAFDWLQTLARLEDGDRVLGRCERPSPISRLRRRLFINQPPSLPAPGIFFNRITPPGPISPV